MNDTLLKIYEDSKPILAKLSESIGQGAGFGYEVIVRQKIAEGTAMAAVAIFFALLLVIAYSVLPKVIAGVRRHRENCLQGQRSCDAMVALGTFYGIGTAIFLGMVLGFGVSAILKLLNPHYYAIKEVISLLLNRSI